MPCTTQQGDLVLQDNPVIQELPRCQEVAAAVQRPEAWLNNTRLCLACMAGVERSVHPQAHALHLTALPHYVLEPKICERTDQACAKQLQQGQGEAPEA